MSLGPADAPERDWNLYFDRTFLLHEKLGPVFCRVEDGPDGPAFMVRVKGDAMYKPVPPSQLSLFWPRSGAYNGTTGAFFLGRQGRRSMKKSASYEHYFVMWPETGFIPGMARESFLDTAIYKGRNFLSYKAAREVLEKKVMTSVAISKDIILNNTKEPGKYQVIFAGEAAGFVKGQEFFAEWDGTPAAKRTRAKLLKENILCI